MPGVLARPNCQEMSSPRSYTRYFTTNLILELRRHGTRLKPLNRREGKTPLGGELAADPLHLLVLKESG
jgi:hypothetical protein